VATGTKRRGYETLRDMLLSLGVIVLGVIGFVVLQPNNDEGNPVPTVDYQAQIRLLQRSASFPFLAPDPVPPGWEVNYARIGTAGSTELHMGFVLDKKRFAQLDETDRPTPATFAAAKIPSTASGTVTVNGAVWEVRRGDGSGGLARVALVRTLPGGAVATLADGGNSSGASYDEIVGLAGSLREQPVTPAR
jgi:hypothetical protein